MSQFLYKHAVWWLHMATLDIRGTKKREVRRVLVSLTYSHSSLSCNGHTRRQALFISDGRGFAARHPRLGCRGAGAERARAKRRVRDGTLAHERPGEVALSFPWWGHRKGVSSAATAPLEKP